MAKYFEDKLLASEWEEKLTHRISWIMFKNQEKWIDMYGKNGDKTPPRIREEFLDEFENAFNDSVKWLALTIAENLVDGYIKDGIDLDPAMAKWYNNLCGTEPGEEGWVDGVFYEGDKE